MERKMETKSEMIHAVLGNSPIPALRTLKVTATGRSVVLKGRVRTYYQKQMAQELDFNMVLKLYHYILLMVQLSFTMMTAKSLKLLQVV